MARKREAAQPAEQAPQCDPTAPAETRHDTPTGHETPQAAADAGEARRSKWLDRFDSWGDHEAGVQVIEDRQNRRMVVKFDEKPSEAILQVVKSEPYSYDYDRENKVWYKKINPATARQARTEADQLGFTVANIIRQEKGLEQKQAFGLGM
jgi:hypothetical protein